ncbi:MAG: leucine-rich repeat domain-containing protein [Agathobacter sp.]|nr:leucine-rich repeat domain-containing protein [Agathobacter sp.]
MKLLKKAIYVFVAISMIFYGVLFFNTTIYASEKVIASGDCGDNVTWKLYNDGNMIISGTGAIWDMYTDEGFENTVECPWINYRSDIKNVSIESGITVIGSANFRDCVNLEKIDFPDTLKTINIRAFWGCKKLGNCDLPEGLEEIGERIFWDCDSMTSVIIPDSVTYLGASICEDCDNVSYFYIGMDDFLTTKEFIGATSPVGYCPSLEAIEVSKYHIAYQSIDGVLYSQDATELFEYPAGKKDKIYYVDSNTKLIKRFAFNQITHVESIIIPEGVLGIEESFVRKCNNLSVLTLPSTLSREAALTFNAGFTFAHHSAIVGCYNLRCVDNKSNEMIPLDLLTENSIWVDETGKIIKEIGKGKAYQYNPVYDVSLQNNVQLAIDEKINVLKSIQYWNNNVTENTNDLLFISSDSSVAIVSDDGTITAVGNGVVTITVKPRYFRSYDLEWEKTCTVNVGVFSKDEEEVEPVSIKKAKATLSTSSYTYNGKTKKPSVTVTLNGKKLKKDTDYKVTYSNNKNIGTAIVKITGINNYKDSITQKFTIKAKKGATFTSSKCKYEVTSSSTVKFIGITSSSMKKVTIPKTVKYGGKTFKVTEIGKNALKNKSKLTTVVIGANVKTIGVSAFEGCKKLSKVTIGSAVTTIDDKAFKNCTALKSITIPSKVTKIDKEAFYGCKNLKTITIKSTKMKTVGKNALKGIYAKATIKVPSSKLKSYKNLLKNKGQGTKVKIVKMK